jgi:hypothetical protein
MLRVIVAVMVLGLAGTASAQGTASGSPMPAMASETPAPGMTRKPCEELKAEIDTKIKKNGVPMFTLDVVEMDAQAEGKIVGTCDGQTKKIVYKRG